MDSYKLLSVCWAMTWVCVPMVWGVWCDGEVSRLCQWSLAWPDQQSSVVFRPRPPPHACVTTRRQTLSCRGWDVSQPRHQPEVRVRSVEAGQRPETVAGWSAPPRCEQSGIIRVSCEQWAVRWGDQTGNTGVEHTWGQQSWHQDTRENIYRQSATDSGWVMWTPAAQSP